MSIWGTSEDKIIIIRSNYDFSCNKVSLVPENEGYGVVIEEPASPSMPDAATKDRSHDVDIEEIPLSASEILDIEKELEVRLSKRKREEEDRAQRKAKRIYDQFQREGITLDEVIDTVAKDHGELYEKATVVLLGLEDERLKLLEAVREEVRSHTDVNLPFDYGLGDADADKSINLGDEASTEQYMVLEDLRDPEEVNTAPPRKRAKFVSPTKQSNP